MASMNVAGTIDADKTYTEEQLKLILDLSPDQMLEYYRDGLRYYQRTRLQPRLTTGSEFHRFIERRMGEWPDENAAKA